MLRVAFGIVVGVYLAQNYNVPNAKTYLEFMLRYCKEIESNHGAKGKK
jgi:hypothetical protein